MPDRIDQQQLARQVVWAVHADGVDEIVLSLAERGMTAPESTDSMWPDLDRARRPAHNLVKIAAFAE